MKLFVSAAAAALLVASASAAQAGDTYVQVDGGVIVAGKTDFAVEGLGSMESDTEFGFLLGGLIGNQMDNGLAIEGELLVAHNGIDGEDFGGADVSVTSTLLMANAKYAFNSDKAWSPYIGAGVGYGQVRYEIDEAAADDNGVAWQVKAGFTYKDDGRTWDFGYRYIQSPEWKDTDGGVTVTADTSTHALTMGLRF